MIVVAILGILAALAIPAFVGYVRRSKTAEATDNLNKMFKAVAGFYHQPQAAQGVAGDLQSECIVATAGPVPATPTADKQAFTPATDSSFRTVGFSIADFVYYSYTLTSAGAGCKKAASTDSLYTAQAEGDLDGDNTKSTFQLAIGSNAENDLYHARGFYTVNDIE